MVSCKNCGSYFTLQELGRIKPPVHPWPLTPLGKRVLIENEAAGELSRCPRCGCATLRM